VASLLRFLLGRTGPRRSATTPEPGAPSAEDCAGALHAGELDAAVRCFRDYLARHPEDAVAHNNLGVALQRQGRPAEALACYETAVRVTPTHADGWYNAGVIHHLRRNLGEAERCYRNALRVDPAYPEAHREYSMLRLVRGEFTPEVWSSFRHRRRCAGFEAAVTRCSAPDWNGEPLEGKTILVYGEQGLGDEILFSSCYPDLIARARHCVIETDPRLERLFRRSFGAAMALSRDRMVELNEIYPDVSYRVPCGDLPLYFRSTPQAFPAHPAYLAADASGVERWRRSLSALGGGLKVGISWRGGTPRTNQAKRSVGLDDWGPVFQVPGAQFVSLQYGDCGGDLAHARDKLGIDLRHWAEAVADYDETAALVRALDLVITVTTSIAHLSGALGQAVWILANAAPRWCYLSSGSTTPWYPSACVFRQTRPRAWDDVMRRVAGQLAKKVADFEDNPR
jgi:hypothetical protein